MVRRVSGAEDLLDNAGNRRKRFVDLRCVADSRHCEIGLTAAVAASDRRDLLGELSGRQTLRLRLFAHGHGQRRLAVAFTDNRRRCV